MRKKLIALMTLSAAACSRPLDAEAVRSHPAFAFERQIEMRAKEPDAVIVLKPYDAARDQVAASECKAVYASLLNPAVRASIEPAEQKRMAIHARVGSKRVDALIGASESRDKKAVDSWAYIIRHDYVAGPRDTEKGKTDLEQLKPRAAVCDEALAAWGAPEVDEKPIRDALSKELGWQEPQVPARSDVSKE